MVYTQQSLFGMVRNVQTCPDCHGTGKIIRDKCTDCGGSGYVRNKRTIEVAIPAGIDSGQSVRIRGKGEPGTNGGGRGDLLVGVTVDRHPVFKRQGYDIYSDSAHFLCGGCTWCGDITIKTVDGEVDPDDQAGNTDRRTDHVCSGKGVPTIRATRTSVR